MTVEKLWQDLGNVPITDNGNITQRWRKFPKGTHREKIWHWFEEKFNVSVVRDLMKLS